MTGDQQPLVSIVMPSLNQARFLDSAIDSVLEQDYPRFELIVADGTSTDGTLGLLESRTKLDPRLRWFSAPDTGPAQAINRALAKCRGTLIGWLNADDLYAPGAMSRAVTALTDHPQWLMVYGQADHVDAEGRVLERYPTLPPETPIGKFRGGCFICQPTVFFQRSLGILLGPLDESLKTAFDFDYWIRAFAKIPERIAFIDHVQAHSRLHADGITLGQRRAVMREGMEVLARHFGAAPPEWVLTYVEELLDGRVPVPVDSELRAQALSFLEEVRPVLASSDYLTLAEQIRVDFRLDSANQLAPKENAALAMEEYRAGVLEVRSTPKMLTVETTSRCNLRCVMCPHAINAVKRPKHLELALLSKLQRFVKRASAVQLHGIGEPLVSPAFWRVLPILPAATVCESSVNSNLTTLDDARLETLLGSSLKIVNVSVDAATESTYRKIRGHSFSSVVENLRRLINARDDRGQTYPLVYMNMTLMRSNIEELPAFVRLAAELSATRVLCRGLNHWSEQEMARYVVDRDDWIFDYAQEGLWNDPELERRCVDAAAAQAVALDMPFNFDRI